MIVIEELGTNEEGGVEIPDYIEFHLGKEYFNQMFGEKGQYFTLPTAALLAYDAKRQNHEIALAFYLCNILNVSAGEKSMYFHTLVEHTALADEYQLAHDDHRMRDAMRILYALERLEMDGIIRRAEHRYIDQALAAEYYAKGKATPISEQTRQRIERKYSDYRTLSEIERRKIRREALQNLLAMRKNDDQNDDARKYTIKFTAGPLIINQIQRRKEQIDAATERRKRAIEAAAKGNKKAAKSE
jgi:hypothetical protein